MSKKASQSQPAPQAGAGSELNFLVRTMIERESTGKRTIRPKNVEDLFQSTIEDKSSDPDFDCEGEDSNSAGSLEESQASNDSKAGDEKDDDDSDDSDDEDYQVKNEDGQESGSDSNSDANSSRGSDDDEDASINEDSQGSASISQMENRNQIKVLKPICSHCLGDKSDDLNKILECGSCGISVHEACFGTSQDNVSISSGPSISRCTEPWFCDVCKSGVDIDTKYCELCPVKGGFLKESKTGQWVHLVCAVYTPGVVVLDDGSIDLLGLQYTRWGAHSCAGCEDKRKAQTGIVISCDAGMCKTYFHATCAQKLGLLSEVDDVKKVDLAEAEPYYLSCKKHTNKETIKRGIRLFNKLQEQLRIKKERKATVGLSSESNTDQARILRKLDKVRQKTAERVAQYLTSLERPPLSEELADPLGDNVPSTNGSRKQRLLHTSAKLGDDFVRKMDSQGDDLRALQLEVKHERIVANIRKKQNVLPTMSVGYAAYYGDREDRIECLEEQYEQSVKENEELMDKEIALKAVFETRKVNQMAMREETESVLQTLESLANTLTEVNPGEKKFTSKLHSLVKPKELAGRRRKSPNSSKGETKLAVDVCDICSKSDRPHLITNCDKCKRNYHLSCLNPPLTQLPKRSRLYGWMCSSCCTDDPENTEIVVDTDAPRTLRRRTQIHKSRESRGSNLN